MKLLGIDYGTKRIGLAISNDDGDIAFPDQVIENDSRLLQIISLIVAEKDISKVIVGESKNYQMKDNQVMEEISDFAQALQTQINIPVEFHSEMMSSVEAEKIGGQLSGNAKEKRNSSYRSKGKVEELDAKAAAVILQSYIEANKK